MIRWWRRKSCVPGKQIWLQWPELLWLIQNFRIRPRQGQYQEINYCIGCLQGCTKGCLVNPMIGHESEYDLTPVAVPKKYMLPAAELLAVRLLLYLPNGASGHAV